MPGYAGWLLLLGVLGTAAASAAEPEPPYKTHFRPINVHLHCGQPSAAAVRAELAVCDRTGIDKVVILDGGSPPGSLPKWLELKRQFSDRLIVFYKLDLRNVARPGFFVDIVTELEEAAQSGVQGVKVWKDLGMYNQDGEGKLLAMDDPRLDPFFARCGELGLPVMIHAADPREYWHPLTYHSLHYGLRTEADQHYHNPAMPKWEELIRQRDHVLEKHPRTNFIGAHLGSLCQDLERLGRTFEKHPNFHADCAARLRFLGRLNPPAVRAFFIKYQDRLLFGTDDGILSKGRRPGQAGNISLYPADDPNWLWHDPADEAAVRDWKEKHTWFYSQYLQYFETDRLDLSDPSRSGGAWLRIPAVQLPAEVLEKFYRTNAERLIPGLRAK
ncbi:MAG: amidohydrolase family protein [Pirellulaceae bacterium]|nr:amidohydrolase family protein [Pirellulaceae bacterium]